MAWIVDFELKKTFDDIFPINLRKRNSHAFFLFTTYKNL